MRILIVEDEVRLADTLRDLVEMDGFTADVRHDGESGLDEALTGIYACILLDVMLPKLGGFALLRCLRKEGIATPVLLLTARAEVEDKVRGLDTGADYYLTKPFEPQELLACVRALCRRPAQMQDTKNLTCGDLRLEQSSFTLFCGEKSVRLSRKEYDMMELLMRNQKLVLTKEKLLVNVWGYDTDAEENNVEVYISFLRRKLAYLRSASKITTIRMAGYTLTPGEAAT
jgi:DNA-binding response OmpR family regulator